MRGSHVKSAKKLLRQTAIELVKGKELLAQKKARGACERESQAKER